MLTEIKLILHVQLKFFNKEDIDKILRINFIVFKFCGLFKMFIVRHFKKSYSNKFCCKKLRFTILNKEDKSKSIVKLKIAQSRKLCLSG